jgi:hypothetical protein
MTEQERQEIKARLIELGFWGADEPGDPTTDHYEAGVLHNRLQAKLATNTYLISDAAPDRLLTREIVIFCDYQAYKLAAADNYPEAICLAALALPEFLGQHPKCAVDQE